MEPTELCKILNEASEAVKKFVESGTGEAEAFEGIACLEKVLAGFEVNHRQAEQNLKNLQSAVQDLKTNITRIKKFRVMN